MFTFRSRSAAQNPAVAALVALCLLVGCVEDDYRCTFDEQCNLGETGRCELDGRCTAYDDDCPSHRRYTEHSGVVSGTCFDDAVVPLNPCADGQPPTRPEGCFGAVCAAVPACCETGWSNACVQQAQLACPQVRCDTRIAITASNGNVTELWDVRSADGETWTADPLTGSLVAWVAPVPGTAEPRLARVDVDGLFLDDALHPLSARSYTEVTSVDLDRSGHDTLVLGSTDTTTQPVTRLLEIHDLTNGTRRDLAFDASLKIEWGDYDHDAFPDAVIAGTAATYVGALNVEAPDRLRVFEPQARANVSGMVTVGQDPAIRAFAWADLDGDRTLDLIVAGSSIRVHVAEQTSTLPPVVTDEFSFTVDCHPVTTMGTGNCNMGVPAGTEVSSFAVAAVPRAGGADVALVAFPQPEATLLSVTRAPAITPTLAAIPMCSTCEPIVAIVARDLNHDGVLDLIGIDAKLGLWTKVSPAAELTFVLQIRPPVAFNRVRVSVTGGV